MPTARVGSATESVKAAAREGAEEVPHAAPHLARAEARLSRARALIALGEYEDAEALLTHAEADAHAASSLARKARSAETPPARPAPSVARAPRP